MEIRPVLSTEFTELRALFREYAASVGNDICFQTFEEELAALPGAYASPGGEILVAVAGPELTACVALRPLGPGICEMKRLYVRPAFRGLGLGRKLTEDVLKLATAKGYAALRLDTLPQMTGAITLYQALGFQPIPRYGDNPSSALCFEKLLKSI